MARAALNAQILGPDVQLQFNSVTGRNYRVESTTALTGGVWQVAVPAITGVGGAMSVTNAGGATGPQQFYRMALQP